MPEFVSVLIRAVWVRLPFTAPVTSALFSEADAVCETSVRLADPFEVPAKARFTGASLFEPWVTAKFAKPPVVAFSITIPVVEVVAEP